MEEGFALERALSAVVGGTLFFYVSRTMLGHIDIEGHILSQGGRMGLIAFLVWVTLVIPIATASGRFHPVLYFSIVFILWVLGIMVGHAVYFLWERPRKKP